MHRLFSDLPRGAVGGCPGRGRRMADDAAPGGFAGRLGAHVEEADDGSARIAFEVRDEHLNPAGTLHGGVLATLVDTAMGTAVRSATDDGDVPATSQLTVTYLRPGRPGAADGHRPGADPGRAPHRLRGRRRAGRRSLGARRRHVRPAAPLTRSSSSRGPGAVLMATPGRAARGRRRVGRAVRPGRQGPDGVMPSRFSLTRGTGGGAAGSLGVSARFCRCGRRPGGTPFPLSTDDAPTRTSAAPAGGTRGSTRNAPRRSPRPAPRPASRSSAPSAAARPLPCRS